MSHERWFRNEILAALDECPTDHIVTKVACNDVADWIEQWFIERYGILDPPSSVTEPCEYPGNPEHDHRACLDPNIWTPFPDYPTNPHANAPLEAP